MSYDQLLESRYDSTILCSTCGEETSPGTECEKCGEYTPTKADIKERMAEEKFDHMRDNGGI